MFQESRGTPVEFGLSDKMNLYMELIALHRQNGNAEESNNVMQEAMLEFKVRLFLSPTIFTTKSPKST
jgi:hypothetical protein